MQSELVSKILNGDTAAAAKLITGLENEELDAAEQLKELYFHSGRACVVGITGAPGVGKSTLIDSLIDMFTSRKLTLGIIAIDPTSPLTGGALLGDRLRMRKHAADEHVFIRSLATRGWLGGLTKATAGTVHVMDAMGKDIIIIETVGTGQADIDVAKISDTCLLVLNPGMGDEVQAMKAGILELADIFVINKADMAGAEETKHTLAVMLEMRDYTQGSWRPPVILTSAMYGKGIKDLAEEILKHKEFITSTGELEESRLERTRLELFKGIESSLKNYAYGCVSNEEIEKLVRKLVDREIDLSSAVLEIVKQFGRQV